MIRHLPLLTVGKEVNEGLGFSSNHWVEVTALGSGIIKTSTRRSIFSGFDSVPFATEMMCSTPNIWKGCSLVTQLGSKGVWPFWSQGGVDLGSESCTGCFSMEDVDAFQSYHCFLHFASFRTWPSRKMWIAWRPNKVENGPFSCPTYPIIFPSYGRSVQRYRDQKKILGS